MTRYERIMTGVYATMYLIGLLVVCMDVFYWRAEEPKPSGAQIQAKAQLKGAR